MAKELTPKEALEKADKILEEKRYEKVSNLDEWCEVSTKTASAFCDLDRILSNNEFESEEQVELIRKILKELNKICNNLDEDKLNECLRLELGNLEVSEYFQAILNATDQKNIDFDKKDWYETALDKLCNGNQICLTIISRNSITDKLRGKVDPELVKVAMLFEKKFTDRNRELGNRNSKGILQGPWGSNEKK